MNYATTPIFRSEFRKSYKIELYRNNMKNRDFDKEAYQNSCLERATIALGQGASEDKNFEGKPTQSKTDSSDCFGIILQNRYDGKGGVDPPLEDLLDRG